MPAVLWFLCLIWLAVFLEDSGIPLAILIAGLVWWIYTSFEIQLDAGVPEIVAGGCLLGGTAGGLLGGIVRKVNASSQKISLMLTAMGSLLGFILGYGLLAVFAGLMWV